MAFQFHYSQPTLCYIAVFGLLLIVLAIGIKARVSSQAGRRHESLLLLQKTMADRFWQALAGRFRIFSGVQAEREPQSAQSSC